LNTFPSLDVEYVMTFNLFAYAAFILEWKAGHKITSQPNYAVTST
jgi:hypothetical protein